VITCTDGDGLTDSEGFYLTIINDNDALKLIFQRLSVLMKMKFIRHIFGIYVQDVDFDDLSLSSDLADNIQIDITDFYRYFYSQ